MNEFTQFLVNVAIFVALAVGCFYAGKMVTEEMSKKEN